MQKGITLTENPKKKTLNTPNRCARKAPGFPSLFRGSYINASKSHKFPMFVATRILENPHIFKEMLETPNILTKKFHAFLMYGPQ